MTPPVIVSDPIRLELETNNYAASRALTDSDESHWIGKDNEGNAHFIYDLGCVTSLSKLVLHNSRNGDYRDRQASRPSTDQGPQLEHQQLSCSLRAWLPLRRMSKAMVTRMT